MNDKILGILPKFWKRRSNGTNPVGSSSWWANFLAGFQTKSNVPMYRDNAQAIPAFLRAVNLTSETMASLPWDVYERRDGGIYVAENDPVRRLLMGRMSPYSDNFTLRDAIHRRLMLHGNAFLFIYRNGNGFPTELELWEGTHPDMMPVSEPGKRKELFYKFDGRPAISQWDVIHLRLWSIDGYKGQDPLVLSRESLGQSLAQIEYGASFFGNGAHVSGSIETEKVLTDNQKSTLNHSINAVSGTESVGDILVLDGGLKYKHIGVNPVDAGLADLRRLSTEDIANITGVPVFLLNNLERATFSNIEHLDRTFVQYTLRMHCKRYEEEFSTKLYPRRDWGRKFIKYDLNGLLQGDTDSRSNFYNSLFQVGALSPNDIRQMENLNPYEGGDQYYTPLNMSGDEEE